MFFQALTSAKSGMLIEALKWHPDKNTDPHASTHFAKIAEAYEILSNPDMAFVERMRDSGKFKDPNRFSILKKS